MQIHTDTWTESLKLPCFGFINNLLHKLLEIPQRKHNMLYNCVHVIQ